MLRIIIAGSRQFNDFQLLERSVFATLFDLNKNNPELNILTIDKAKRKFKINNENIEIISGMAKGADTLGVKFAEKYNLVLKKFPAKWDDLCAIPCKILENSHGRYNALAGHNRNQKMAEYASNDNSFGVLILFWDGKSSGSKNMKNQAIMFDLKIYEINI